MSRLISVITANIKVIREDYGFRLIMGSNIDKFPFDVFDKIEVSKYYNPNSLGIVYEIKIFNTNENLIKYHIQNWLINFIDSNDNWKGKWPAVPEKDGWIKMENI